MKQQIDLREAIAILERTPAALASLLDGLPDAWLKATEGESTWSAYHVVRHLVHGEKTDWMVRARHILAGEMRPFDPFDQQAVHRENVHDTMAELLEKFAQLRAKNIAELAGLNLKDADLARKGLHPDLGEVTLSQLIATWVVHDLDHLAQVARTMAKVYGAATGPWSKYLSILRDRQK